MTGPYLKVRLGRQLVFAVGLVVLAVLAPTSWGVRLAILAAACIEFGLAGATLWVIRRYQAFDRDEDHRGPS